MVNFLAKLISGKKRYKTVTIETPGQSDMEERELEMELEKFSLPVFGDSPGGTPSITPPSDQASPRERDMTEVRPYRQEWAVFYSLRLNQVLVS